jgi:hypothetical protein
MNMPNLDKLILATALLGMLACKKETSSVFGVNEQLVQDERTSKIKNKSEAEYISILYTNLYQKPISPNTLYKTQNILVSIGDRSVANEMLLSNYFNTGNLDIPSDIEMRSNIDSFVVSSYKKFFLRYPNEAEKLYFKNYIGKNAKVSVEMVYTSMSVCNEYQYY